MKPSRTCIRCLINPVKPAQDSMSYTHCALCESYEKDRRFFQDLERQQRHTMVWVLVIIVGFAALGLWKL